TCRSFTVVRLVHAPPRQRCVGCPRAPTYNGQMSDNPRESRAERAPDLEPGADLPNVPLLEDELAHEEGKPTWRGWIHAGTFPLAIVLGVVLLVVADGAAARISSAIFVASSLLLFGISALYHRFNWSEGARQVL